MLSLTKQILIPIGSFLLLTIMSAYAQGFSVRGATTVNFGTGNVSVSAEAEYAFKLSSEWKIGIKSTFSLDPISDNDIVLIVPNLFTNFETTLYDWDGKPFDTTAKLELGLGVLPRIFPRLLLSGEAQQKTLLAVGVSGFALATASFDFVVTNRAEIGLSIRTGAVIVPFVPYLTGGVTYDLYPGTGSFTLALGSLIYFTPESFVGLEVGFNPGGFVRVFFQIGAT